MEMSFKEKSTWISLLCTICIFAYYFYNLGALVGIPEVQAKAAATSLATRAIIYIVIAETLFQALLSASNHRDAELGNDERDQIFSYKSNRVAYSILVTGVFITLGRLVLVEYNPNFADHNSSLQIPMLTAHILLFSFILSEVARFATQLFYYRRGY